MIWEIVKEERKALRANVYLFNKANIPYLSINYLIFVNVAVSKMRHRIDRYTAKQSTYQVNSAKLTNIQSTLYKKMIF